MIVIDRFVMKPEPPIPTVVPTFPLVWLSVTEIGLGADEDDIGEVVGNGLGDTMVGIGVEVVGIGSITCGCC
jgi:hypothetical protein